MFVSALLVGVGAAVAFSEQDAAVDGRSGEEGLQRFSRRGTLEAGTTITIDNPFGDVRLRRGGDDGGYQLNGVLQQLGPEGRRLQIRAEKSDAGLEVSVGWINKPGVEATAILTHVQSRADLVVMVPDGIGVTVETAAGRIEAKEIRNDLELTSDTGAIRAAGVHGTVNARSNSGDIHVAFADRKNRETQRFQTVTGSIAVWIAPAADMDITMQSSGTLTTDFTLKVDHKDHEEPDKVGTAKVGKGGSDVVMESLRGNLFLRRRVVVD